MQLTKEEEKELFEGAPNQDPTLEELEIISIYTQ